MDIKTLYKRVDEQLAEAKKKYYPASNKLKYATSIFKPDSPKLETVSSVEIGYKNKQTNYMTCIRYFYSPHKYGYGSASELEKDIKTYLKRKKINPI